MQGEVVVEEYGFRQSHPKALTKLPQGYIRYMACTERIQSVQRASPRLTSFTATLRLPQGSPAGAGNGRGWKLEDKGWR